MCEGGTPRVEKSKIDKVKWMVEKSLKKRKLSYSSYSSGKFGTKVDHLLKLIAPLVLKLMKTAMKVEVVRRANEEA